MNMKKLFLPIMLAASIGLVSIHTIAQENVCEVMAQLAKTVGKGRADGLTKKQQQDVAKIALAQNGNQEIYKLHLSMVDNAYKNDLDADEMAIIYYMACKKSGL